ncbi:hypothetical protein, partial [Xanthovirga aplysinae]|uniref:hypothetical protein n=1 Tax=Xanthovirga aplysinae TaxID=2529853 RepID=UPI001CA4014B
MAKQCTITNNTNFPLVVIIPSDPQGDEVTYNQDLMELDIEDNTGSTISEIAPRTSGTVVLDQSYIDPTTNQSTYSLNYNLLIS